MAVLHHCASGRRAHLCSRHLVGRSSRSDLILASSRVSAEHAVVSWSEEWQVKDLGSRNGTFVNGVRLAPGERARLVVGARVSFADPDDPWEVSDDHAPVPSAKSADGTRVLGTPGLLALPSAEQPLVTCFRDGQGRWLAETHLQRTAVVDGQTLDVSGTAWQLQLPEPLVATTSETHLELVKHTLLFQVSRDEEHVLATLTNPRATLELGTRVHHYLLLTLARHRLTDAGAGEPESAQGWVDQVILAKELRISEALLHIHVHRARVQLAELGVRDAASIVERRPAAKQLRLGIAAVEVERV